MKKKIEEQNIEQERKKYLLKKEGGGTGQRILDRRKLRENFNVRQVMNEKIDIIVLV